MTEEIKKTTAPTGRHAASTKATSSKTGAKHTAKPGAKSAAKQSSAKAASKPHAKSNGKSGAKGATSFGAVMRQKFDAATNAISEAASGAKAKPGASKGKKKNKRKGILHSTFYRVYFAVVLLCVIGIVVGANWLRGLLADYEAAQPSHAAEAAAQMFEDGDFESVYAYDTNAAAIGGDEQYYVDSMREIARGKEVSWSETYSSTEDEKVYNVLLSGEKFAEMTLVPSGETTKHGNRLWKLGSVTTNVTMGEQEVPEEIVPEEEPPVEEEEPEVPTGIPCRISVPSQFTVTVDGTTLDPADTESAAVPIVPEGLLPEGVPNPTMTEYLIYSESGAPQIAVTDTSGNPQQLSENGDHSWTCALPEDAQLKEQFEKPIVEIAKSIARCAAKTSTKDAVLRYCVKNSPASKSINSFDNSTGYSKKPESFENIVTGNYYRYADNCFSCHVSFDYLSKFTAKVTKTYPTTLTLYFVYQENAGKLYSFTLY